MISMNVHRNVCMVWVVRYRRPVLYCIVHSGLCGVDTRPHAVRTAKNPRVSLVVHSSIYCPPYRVHINLLASTLLDATYTHSTPPTYTVHAIIASSGYILISGWLALSLRIIIRIKRDNHPDHPTLTHPQATLRLHKLSDTRILPVI